MANKIINTFGGVNTDTSINKYPNNKYYSAKNLRILSNDALSSGALSTVQAPSAIIEQLQDDGTILGSTTIRDIIVIFFVSDDDDSYIFKIDPVNASITPVYDDSISVSKLNFKVDRPIRAIGRYENEDVQKVYWCDGLNPNSFINIAEDNTGKEASLFKLTPDAELNSPVPINVSSGGVLESGNICYTYQLYRQYGNQTSMSPSSFTVPLSSSNRNNIKNFKGDEVGVNTGQSVTVSINNLDSRFNRIKLYSIHFADLNADPTINLVSDQEFLDTSVEIVDTGAIVLDTITTEEFLMSGGRIFSSETLETKFNYLFAGNIKETSTDIEFDARTYRFDNSGIGYSVDIGGTSTPVSSSNWDDVDDTADAVNPFNDFDNDLEYKDAVSGSPSMAISSENYKYVSGGGGSLQGGSGPNISYGFMTENIESNVTDAYKSGKLLRNINDISKSFLNPILAGKYKGYKRGEVYRFGIEFHFKNGQKSFVKWIGDIRFPAVWEYALSEINSDVISNRQLGLRLTIDLRDLEPDVYNSLSGVKIVRAKRTEVDKNILGQGLFGAYQTAAYDDATNIAKSSYARVPGIYDISIGQMIATRTELLGGQGAPTVVPLSATLYELDSPDFIFGSSPLYSGNDYINLIASHDINHDNNIDGESTGLPRGFFKEKNYTQNLSTTNLRGFNYKRLLTSITTPSIKTEGGTVSSLFSFASKTCSNRVILANDNRDYNGIRSKHLLTEMDTSVPADTVTAAAIDLSPGSSGTSTFVAEYIRNKFGSQYGGNTYEARQVNNYIPAVCRLGTDLDDDVVEFIPISEFAGTGYTSVDVFGGDTYVSNFDYLRSQFDQNIGTEATMQEYITFPVETSLNLDYRRDEVLKYYTGLTDQNTNVDIYKIQEEKTFGISLFPDVYPDQLTDLYLYNDAYSRNNDITTNTQVPENFQETLTLDTMVTASEKKFNGESIDSWTNYKFNTFLEVDSTYGPLNVLKHHNNILYFLQDHGTGVLAIEDRAQVSTSAGSLLSLGSGAVLERFDYISTNFGCLRDEAVISTPNNLYFIDETDKSIRIPSDSDLKGNLSKIKGVSSKLHNILPSTYISLGFDPVNKEVMFSFDHTTFVYSELTQEFIGDYDVVADKTFDGLSNIFKADTYEVIKDVMYLISYNNADTALNVHKANESSEGMGDYGEVTILIHPNGNDIFTFDNLDLRTHVFDSFTKNLPMDVDVVADTVHEIDYKNSYLDLTQVTTDPGLSTALINRLARSWRTQVPLTDTDNRFTDSYLMVTLRYNNSNSNKILIHDVTSYVRKANINI